MPAVYRIGVNEWVKLSAADPVEIINLLSEKSNYQILG